jgi:hypothetical protein
VPNALGLIQDKGGKPEKLLVWLDDLQEYLRAGGGLMSAHLDELRDAGNLVLATIRTSEYQKLRSTGPVPVPESKALSKFKAVWLEPKLSEDKLGRFYASVSDERIRQAVVRYGLAEYVGGGPEAIKSMQIAKTEQPLAYAFVRAAADWRRSGLEFAAQDTLVHLAPTYFPRRVGDIDANPITIEAALQWAADPERVGSTIGLLERRRPDRGLSEWRVFDYILDGIENARDPIPDITWSVVVEKATTPAEMNDVGFAAYEHDRADLTERLWRRAADEHDPPGYAHPRMVVGPAG